MSKSVNPLLILSGAAAAYFLFLSPSGSGGESPATSALSNLLPGIGPAQIPVTYGINSGVRSGVGGAYGISNYPQLAQANPNLTNPNYQLSNAEANQYLSNYQDVQQWWSLPSTKKDFNNNVYAAIQYHWTKYGCAEKRIFLPLQPPSNIAYVPPPPNPKSSGGGLLGSLLKVATVAVGVIVPGAAAFVPAALTAESAIRGTDDAGLLNDAELQLLFQSAAIIYDILPFYYADNSDVAVGIKIKLDGLLKQYS